MTTDTFIQTAFHFYRHNTVYIRTLRAGSYTIQETVAKKILRYEPHTFAIHYRNCAPHFAYGKDVNNIQLPMGLKYFTTIREPISRFCSAVQVVYPLAWKEHFITLSEFFEEMFASFRDVRSSSLHDRRKVLQSFDPHFYSQDSYLDLFFERANVRPLVQVIGMQPSLIENVCTFLKVPEEQWAPYRNDRVTISTDVAREGILRTLETEQPDYREVLTDMYQEDVACYQKVLNTTA